MSNNFIDLGISEPILKAIADMGFQTPTEVQSRVIPRILKQEDLIVMSKTGSGKTAVFGIPLLQLTDPDALESQALILTPTRELAVQIENDLKQMSAYLPHKVTAVYGQHSMNLEIQDLKKGPSIVVGTPGRVFDHIRHGNLRVKNMKYLVLDEADRMLDMGFIDQVFKIIKTMPKNRNTLLFSATIPSEIQSICRGYMRNPDKIEIESKTKTVDTINQKYYRLNKNEKRTQLHRMLMLESPESCLIFCNTRYAVDQVQNFLTSKGYASQAIHGDIPQKKRLTIMQQFKEGNLHLLVATDVAARGIHIEDLALVINYDVPLEKDNYVHRIGRTGRAGKGGRAITFVTGDDIMSLYEIEEHIGAQIEEAELPTDQEISEIKSEAEKWIKEKFQTSSMAPAHAHREFRSREPQSSQTVQNPRTAQDLQKTQDPAKKKRRRKRKPSGTSSESQAIQGQQTSAAAAGSPRETARPSRSESQRVESRPPRSESQIGQSRQPRSDAPGNASKQVHHTAPVVASAGNKPEISAVSSGQAHDKGTVDPLFKRFLKKILNK